MEKTEISFMIFIIENIKKLKDNNQKVNGIVTVDCFVHFTRCGKNGLINLFKFYTLQNPLWVHAQSLRFQFYTNLKPVHKVMFVHSLNKVLELELLTFFEFNFTTALYIS